MNYIVLDIGGTAIKYGVINDEIEFLEKGLVSTNTSAGGEVIVNQCCEIINQLLPNYEIKGVGISTAGMVDTNNGLIYYSSPLIPDYTGTNFKKIINNQFALPCFVENDVNCAGLAESLLGAGKGEDVVFTATIGTGIGGCITIDGKVFHGHNFAAGEVGYLKMFDHDFQMIGSSKVLVERVAQLKNDDVKNWDGLKIFEGAQNGDLICDQAIEEMCHVIGHGFANISYVINPSVIVVGGGIAAQGDYLLKRIDKYLAKYLLPQLYNNLDLKIAHFANDAGMIGAYLNFKQKEQD